MNINRAGEENQTSKRKKKMCLKIYIYKFSRYKKVRFTN